MVFVKLDDRPLLTLVLSEHQPDAALLFLVNLLVYKSNNNGTYYTYSMLCRSTRNNNHLLLSQFLTRQNK